MVSLSQKSVEDLKNILNASYGSNFCDDLSEEDIQQLGNSILIVISENLKLKSCITS